MRKLASIQKIESLFPIEGADRIELATILGWHVIVKKGEFKVSDKCVYVEIDSQLPERPEFEFLRDKGFKIKTMKMKGVVSQGICFPMSILPTGIYEIEDDVTDVLGVIKYDSEDDSDLDEPEVQKKRGKLFNFLMQFAFVRSLYFKIFPRKKGFGTFPSQYISKTDETRIQNMTRFVSENAGKKFYMTEKLDGTSATYVLIKKKNLFFINTFNYLVCSRNKMAGEGSYYARISYDLDIKNTLKYIFKTSKAKEFVAIQGEIIGSKIQKNKYDISGLEFFGFNLIIDGSLIEYDVMSLILNDCGINPVPMINVFLLPDNVDEIVEMSIGNSTLLPRNREGIVCRMVDNPKASFKAINPEFLLENESKKKKGEKK